MDRYISESIRLKVAKRAHFRCEYCLIFERYAFLPFHTEHIISLKHGGNSDEDNLAFSCPVCNYSKGSNVGTYDETMSILIRLFHPRKDNWNEHFELQKTGLIVSKSAIGKATIKILDLNHVESVEERKTMIDKDLI